MKFILIVANLSFLILLASCGGGGSSTAELKTGKFLDSAVNGLPMENSHTKKVKLSSSNFLELILAAQLVKVS
jgi:hypothetical protein